MEAKMIALGKSVTESEVARGLCIAKGSYIYCGSSEPRKDSERGERRTKSKTTKKINK